MRPILERLDEVFDKVAAEPGAVVHAFILSENDFADLVAHLGELAEWAGPDNHVYRKARIEYGAPGAKTRAVVYRQGKAA